MARKAVAEACCAGAFAAAGCQAVTAETPPRRKIGRPIIDTTDPDSQDLTEAERRRIKRREANRESARRVRLKRQEAHTAMAERLANIYSEAAALEALLQQAQSECTAIAKQIEQMRRAPTGAAECKQLGDEAAGAITAMAASAPASDDREGLHTSAALTLAAAASKPASPALITNTAGDVGGAGGGVVSSGVSNDLRASRTESCCTMAQAAAAVYGSRTAAWGAAMPSATGAAAPPRISVTPAAGTMRLQWAEPPHTPQAAAPNPTPASAACLLPGSPCAASLLQAAESRQLEAILAVEDSLEWFVGRPTLGLGLLPSLGLDHQIF